METGVRTEPRQSRSRDKRDRVLAAAGALLESMPYDEVTTKEIAARAEVSVGSLYRFFVDKQAIVDALAQQWLDGMIEVLDGALAAAPDNLDAFIDGVVEAFAAFWRGEHEISSAGLRQIWFGPVKARFAPDANADNDRELVDHLYNAMTTRLGMPPGARLRTRLSVAVAVADDMITRAFRTDPHGDQQVLDELKIMLGRYLTAP